MQQQRRRRRPALSHTKSGRSVAAAAALVASVPVWVGRPIGRSVGRPQFVRLGCTAPFARSLKTELLEYLATGLVMTNVWIKPV